MKQSITITRRDNGFILSVDGGSKECATWSEALSIVESEGGMPLAKAHRELFEKCKIAEEKNAELVEMLGNAEKDRDRYKEWWYKLHEENRKLKAAIVKCFVKTFGKEG